jgi:hypothetical protein
VTRAFAAMPSRYKAILIAIGVALVLAAYFSGEEEVSLSEAAWDCALADNQWKCRVSFEIRNKNQSRQVRRLSLKGLQIPPDGRQAALKVCGEKSIDIDLTPMEILKIDETVAMSGKPDAIKISIGRH